MTFLKQISNKLKKHDVKSPIFEHFIFLSIFCEGFERFYILQKTLLYEIDDKRNLQIQRRYLLEITK